MTSRAAQRILVAVEEILVNRGVEDVTIRNVAAVAGVSLGAVQYHFQTKDELLIAAMEKVSDDFLRRFMSAADSGPDAKTTLAEVCRMLGGVDDESRIASVIWLAFASKAATSEAVARAHQKSWRLLESGIAALLQQLNPALEQDDAAMLIALLDGISIARATETDRMTSQRAQHLITTFLERFER